MGIVKPSLETMRQATAQEFPEITPTIRDSMAIPSFLHRNPLVRWLVWRRYEVMADICRFRMNESVLEFGCGPGFFLPELSSRGCRITALDLYPQYAKHLCGLTEIEVEFPESIEEVRGSSIDTIIAAQVLEHLDAPETYCKHFRRILVPGGKLVVSLPTENLIYKAGRIAAGFAGKGDYHVSSAGRVVSSAENCGFRVNRKVSIPNGVIPLYRVFELH